MMGYLNNTKLWVGDDPDLMKAVTTVLEKNGYHENKGYNKEAADAACRGLYIDSCGEWYYSKAQYPDGNSPFAGVSRRQISLCHVLPIVDSDTIRNTFINVKDAQESRLIQERLLALGCRWLQAGQVVQETDKPQLLVHHDRRITYSSKTQDRWTDKRRIFIHQLQSPTQKQQHDTERNVDTVSGAAAGSCLCTPGRPGKISSTERLIGHPLCLEPGRGRIVGKVLRGTVLAPVHSYSEAEDRRPEEGPGGRRSRSKGTVRGVEDDDDLPF